MENEKQLGTTFSSKKEKKEYENALKDEGDIILFALDAYLNEESDSWLNLSDDELYSLFDDIDLLDLF